jgi:hypothetical protein
MKTIYSLKEFRQQVLAIAALANETYTTVSVEMDHNGKCSFRCYVNGYSSHIGETMEESLTKLREKISPLPPKDIDIIVEMEETTDTKDDVSVIN